MYSDIQNFLWIQRKLEDIRSGSGLVRLVEGTELTSISGEFRGFYISAPQKNLVWEERTDLDGMNTSGSLQRKEEI